MNDIIKNDDDARQIARVIVSDISAYNEQKILEGIKKDNLFALLKDEIEESAIFYRSKVTKEISENKHFFSHALVDILVHAKSYIETSIW